MPSDEKVEIGDFTVFTFFCIHIRASVLCFARDGSAAEVVKQLFSKQHNLAIANHELRVAQYVIEREIIWIGKDDQMYAGSIQQ